MSQKPTITIIILNYNGEKWIRPCLDSIRKQTIFDQLEIIVADNASSDGSVDIAENILKSWPRAKVIRFDSNLGYCDGNNRAASFATGQYLFFLNNDTWLENDCMEQLLKTTQEYGASASTPMIFDYNSNVVQSAGGAGFDFVGLMSLANPKTKPYEVLVVGGCSYFIKKDVFDRLMGFDRVFFMYADEYDLSWRVWLCGEKAIVVPSAHIHHRGAAQVNPLGDAHIVELRTSIEKRFYTNRNNLLVLLKNCKNLLLILVPLQIAYLVVEGLIWSIILRNFKLFKQAYLGAIISCWQLRKYILESRKFINSIRKLSDIQMLRFFRIMPNRLQEIKKVLKLGVPKI